MVYKRCFFRGITKLHFLFLFLSMNMNKLKLIYVRKGNNKNVVNNVLLLLLF